MKSSNPLFHAIRESGFKSVRAAAFIFASLIVCGLLTASAIAQTVSTTIQSPSTPPRGNSTLRGRAVYDDTGRPLRRVRVMLLAVERRSDGGIRQRMAVTDSRGEFSIKNVEAGKYSVFVDAPGVIRQSPFGGDSQDEATTVSVDGTSNAEVQVRARRGGSITGKVTYPDGDPAVSAIVTILLKKGKQFVPYYTGGYYGGAVMTDDRGIYRIFGLPPGEYVVGVGEMSQRVEEREDGGVGFNSGYGTLSATFYPSVTNKTSATAVAVEAGQETSNINITLAERGLHKVSGTIRARSDGQIVTSAIVAIVNKQDLNNGMIGSQTVNVDAQGRWYFDEVPDGDYTLTINPVQDESPEARARAAAAGSRVRGFVEKRMEVSVSGADITGLTIEVSSGARISGTIVVEGGKPLPPNVIIFTKDASAQEGVFGNSSGAQAQMKKDGTFTLESVPEGTLSVLASVPPGGKYFTKAVTASGADLLRDPLTVEDQAEIKDVRITISPDIAQLTGRVLSAEDGKPLPGVGVMLIPADPDMMRIFGVRAYGGTNRDGAFTVSGAPGEYLAIIWRQTDGAYNAETIKARSQNAPRVTLQPNERKTMDLLIPAEK